MLKHHPYGRVYPTSLTWEEKNPTDYLYHESEAVKRLEGTVEELQELTEKKGENEKLGGYTLLMQFQNRFVHYGDTFTDTLIETLEAKNIDEAEKKTEDYLKELFRESPFSPIYWILLTDGREAKWMLPYREKFEGIDIHELFATYEDRECFVCRKTVKNALVRYYEDGRAKVKLLDETGKSIYEGLKVNNKTCREIPELGHAHYPECYETYEEKREEAVRRLNESFVKE